MSKQTTTWRKKGRTPATVDYDDPTKDYDGATVPYAGNGETPESVIKVSSDWRNRVKAITHFILNPASIANDAIYDTTRIYDVAATYDGIVVGEPHSTAKKPQLWSKA